MPIMGNMGNVTRMTHMTHDVQARARLYVYDSDRPGHSPYRPWRAPW